MPQKTSGEIEPLGDMLPDCFRLGTTTIHATALLCGLSRHEKRDAEIRAVAMLIRKAFGEKETLSHLPSGAPYIAGSGKQISITHGAGYALLAINDSRPIGIDIESPRPTLKRISGRFLGSSELQTYNASSSTLLDAWTAKEAIFKALGIPGLNRHNPAQQSHPTAVHDPWENRGDPLPAAAGIHYRIGRNTQKLIQR